jgi:UDP-glucose 4-epimerase
MRKSLPKTSKTGKRVVLAGVNGAVGPSLAHALCRAGYEVIGIGRGRPSADLPRNTRFRYLRCDLAEASQVRRLRVQVRGASAWIHLAGVSVLSECAVDPMRALRGNTLTVAHAIELAHSAGVPRFILFSSGVLYGDRARRAFTEADLPVLDSVYAQTKFMAERLVLASSIWSGIEAVVLRFSNLYSASSRAESVIGRMLNQAWTGQRIEVRDPLPVRDFIYLEDALRAVILAIQNPLPGRRRAVVCNVSTGKPVSIGEMQRIVARCVRLPALATRERSRARSSINYLSPRFLRRWTGWKPLFSLASGLRTALKEGEMRRAP